MAKSEIATVPRLIKEVNAFLDANNQLLRGDAKIYTKKEWNERGEKYGQKAVATLVIDGSPMYGILNDMEAPTLHNKFDSLIESLGYYYEQGYAWTVHFYRKDQ